MDRNEIIKKIRATEILLENTTKSLEVISIQASKLIADKAALTMELQMLKAWVEGEEAAAAEMAAEA